MSTSFARVLILSHSQIAALSRVSIRASPSAASSSSPPGKNVIRLSSLLSLPPTSPCRLPLPPTSSSFFSQPLLPPYDGWRLSPPLFCEAAADPPSLSPSPLPLPFWPPLLSEAYRPTSPLSLLTASSLAWSPSAVRGKKQQPLSSSSSVRRKVIQPLAAGLSLSPSLSLQAQMSEALAGEDEEDAWNKNRGEEKVGKTTVTMKR